MFYNFRKAKNTISIKKKAYFHVVICLPTMPHHGLLHGGPN